MRRAKYKHISIHEDLIKLIDQHIQQSKLGYRSRAEVISHAIRQLIQNQETQAEQNS